MNTETLLEHLPLSEKAISFSERGDLTSRDVFERPSSQRKTSNSRSPVSFFDHAGQESTLAGNRVASPKSSEFRTTAQRGLIDHSCSDSSVDSLKRDSPCSTSENCFGTPQNSLQDTPVPSTRQSFLPLSSDYGDPKGVPGTDQKIYPRASISPKFYERYPQLVDFFKQAVDTHKLLKHHTSEINYELRICGSGPSTAVASIIVFCTEGIFKHLRSLLNSRHIRRQYQLEKQENPFPLSAFPFGASKPHMQASARAIVPFRVVFWRGATTPTERKSAMEQVVAQGQSSLTMCGSLVRYGNRTSTLGLLVSVNSTLYGLTVDHLFKTQKCGENPAITKESVLSFYENDVEDIDVDGSWVDDVTYEDMDHDDMNSNNGSVVCDETHPGETMYDTLTENYRGVINGHKLDFVHKLNATTPFLDWALIEFDGGYFQRPNAFFSDDDPVNPKFLTGVSEPALTSGVPIYMISGVSGTKKGVILGTYSYIGGKLGEDLCQVYNVFCLTLLVSCPHFQDTFC